MSQLSPPRAAMASAKAGVVLAGRSGRKVPAEQFQEAFAVYFAVKLTVNADIGPGAALVFAPASGEDDGIGQPVIGEVLLDHEQMFFVPPGETRTAHADDDFMFHMAAGSVLLLFSQITRKKISRQDKPGRFVAKSPQCAASPVFFPEREGEWCNSVSSAVLSPVSTNGPGVLILSYPVLNNSHSLDFNQKGGIHQP